MPDKKDKNAVFCVPPLKVLVTTKVIRERMDYKDYLGGKVKEELDSFDRLAGIYWVYEDELEVLRKGKKVSEEEWEAMKLRLPTKLASLLEGKEDIKISERTDSEKREWEIQDVDGSLNRLNPSGTIEKRKEAVDTFRMVQFIVDGVLVKHYAYFDPEGKLLFDAKDSILPGDEGIIRSRAGLSVGTMYNFLN